MKMDASVSIYVTLRRPKVTKNSAMEFGENNLTFFVGWREVCALQDRTVIIPAITTLALSRSRDNCWLLYLHTS